MLLSDLIKRLSADGLALELQNFWSYETEELRYDRLGAAMSGDALVVKCFHTTKNPVVHDIMEEAAAEAFKIREFERLFHNDGLDRNTIRD